MRIPCRLGNYATIVFLNSLTFPLVVELSTIEVSIIEDSTNQLRGAITRGINRGGESPNPKKDFPIINCPISDL